MQRTLLLACIAWVAAVVAHAAPPAHGERPPWQDAAAMARWLVHKNDWGTLSTVSRQLSGRNIVPFANAVSYRYGAGQLTVSADVKLALMGR